MQKYFSQLLGRLIVLLSVVFGIHLALLNAFDLPLFGNKIVLAYGVNFLLAFVICTVLFFLRKKYSDQLGFLFMIGSFLKFGSFFILFSGSYREDGQMDRVEFLAFFVPYVVSLFTETLSVIRLLNPTKKTK
ncbi:DUF6168 family protein [Flavicella sediminum]|uniref:DUF6168 family protein n=1 Tax=Flavicella sediminum TaxID=2585141 RepID=UPI001121A6C0|nr:DUF6168 family protein [Flavicella sediminum]